MANEILYKVGTSIIVADTTDYSPTAARTLGTRTDQIDLTGVVAAAARQSAKLDFTATRAMLYDVRLNIEFATDAAGSVDLYMSPSHSGTANIGNVAHCTGSDAAYAAIAGHTLTELLAQLHFIGAAACSVQNTADGIQSIHIGVFSPTDRYGCLVVHNNTADTFHSDAAEMAVGFFPIIAEVQ